MIASQLIIVFISISFIYYSLNSIFSKKMKGEFDRWGFDKFRILISIIQLFTGILLLMSFFYPFLIIYCSSIFFIMMMGAIFVRIRVKDNFLDTLPALIYFILKAIIIYVELK